MAKNGTYNSTVTPSGPNGTMVVTGAGTSSVGVTYAGTTCTVDQNASSGNALKFSLTTGGNTYNFNGACPNNQYRGKCVQAQAAQPRSLGAAAGDGDDNWTATST